MATAKKSVSKKKTKLAPVEASPESFDVASPTANQVEVEKPKSEVKVFQPLPAPSVTQRVKGLRSKKYRQSALKQPTDIIADYNQAIDLVRELSYSKFPGSVELHAKLVSTKKKASESDALRVLVSLPYGTGKVKKVAVASDELIEAIEKGSIDFEVLVAHPSFMPKLAKVAKILGPKGLMPSPKSGTIGEDTDKLVDELAAGRVEIRADADQNIHLAIGKVSMTTPEIRANLDAILAVLPKKRLETIVLSASMSPSVRVKVA